MDKSELSYELPSTDEIIAAMPEGELVIQVPTGRPVEPKELWIASLGVWVRADGFSFSGDYGRGYSCPAGEDRAKIAEAADARLRALAKEDS